jgi:hypothetical protein
MALRPAICDELFFGIANHLPANNFSKLYSKGAGLSNVSFMIENMSALTNAMANP